MLLLIITPNFVYVYLLLRWFWRVWSCCTSRPLPARSQCSPPHTAAGSAHRKSCWPHRSLCVRWLQQGQCIYLLRRCQTRSHPPRPSYNAEGLPHLWGHRELEEGGGRDVSCMYSMSRKLVTCGIALFVLYMLTDLI